MYVIVKCLNNNILDFEQTRNLFINLCGVIVVTRSSVCYSYRYIDIYVVTYKTGQNGSRNGLRYA